MGGQTRNIEERNVLAKMQKTLGPLGVLHGYMEGRTRVKVGHDLSDTRFRKGNRLPGPRAK